MLSPYMTFNFLYFENKSVPPMALLVSGGRISEASVPRIERFIEENLKGKANFHKILILEADGAGTGDGGRAKIELRPLTDASRGTVRWELDADGEFRTQLAGKEDVRAFTCGFVVRGFDVDEGLPLDLGKRVTEPELLPTQAIAPGGDP
jgi:hypothetical protein